MARLSSWVQAARPKTLWASISPVTLAVALVVGNRNPSPHHWRTVLLCYLGAMVVQIIANFYNDYADFLKGADTEERLGPQRTLQAGLIKPREMKRALVFLSILFFLLAYLLYLEGGYIVLVIAFFSILSAFWYTGSRISLAYLGWGDVFAGVFFGPVAVLGTIYLLDRVFLRDHWLALSLISLIPGLYATGLIAVNHLRDREQDSKVNKKTLAVRLGDRFTRIEYVICVMGALSIGTIYLAVENALLGALFCFGVLGLNAGALKGMVKLQGRELNPILEQTGRNMFVVSLLFSLLWVLRRHPFV